MTQEITEIKLGFSPCPNDTFILCAMVHGRVTVPGVEFSPIIKDVEKLNSLVMQGIPHVSKISFHTLGYILDSYVLLETGAALGRGCGPLLISKKPMDTKDIARVVVPGIQTTATLLLKIFFPHVDLVVMRYDQIMPALESGKEQAGVIIHESRFTYASHGLTCLSDLGELWEKETKLPIPLGGIVAKRSLGTDTITAIQEAIALSLEYAQKHGEEVWPYVKEHALEMEDRVIKEHINLYVNRYTHGLGEEGKTAVNRLLELAREKEILPPSIHTPLLEE